MGKRDNSQVTNDIDRELLALTSTHKKRKTSPVEQNSDSEDDYEFEDKKSSSSLYDDEEDEDKKMFREEDFDDEYDDDLMGDDEDRQRLNALPDTKREEIIGARYEQRERLQRKMARLKKEGRVLPRGAANRSTTTTTTDSKKKKKSSSTSTTTSTTSTSTGASDNKDRSKMDKRSAIADIGARRKAIREKSTSGLSFDEEDEEDDDYRASSSSSKSSKSSSSSAKASSSVKKGGSKSQKKTYEKDEEDEDEEEGASEERDHDYSHDDDHDDDEESSSSPSREDEYMLHNLNLKLADVHRILIFRNHLTRWLNEPFFESIIKGCFVRVLLGENDRGERKYNLAEISDVVTGRNEYIFAGQKVDKYLMLKHGVHKKRYRMELISNHPTISDSEFAKWKSEMIRCHEHFPSNEFIEKKEREIRDAGNNNYQQGVRDGASSVSSAIGPRKLLDPGTYYTEKYRLEVQIQDTTDEWKKKQYQEELDKWNERWERQRGLRSNQTQATKRLDYEELLEKAKNRAQRKELFSGRTIQRSKSGELDPFARRTTTSHFFDRDEVTASTKATTTDTNVTKKQEDILKSPGTSLVEAHKFDLDIDIDLNEVAKANNGTLHQLSTRSVPPPDQSANYASYRVLSFNDYQKRRGIST